LVQKLGSIIKRFCYFRTLLTRVENVLGSRNFGNMPETLGVNAKSVVEKAMCLEKRV